MNNIEILREHLINSLRSGKLRNPLDFHKIRNSADEVLGCTGSGKDYAALRVIQEDMTSGANGFSEFQSFRDPRRYPSISHVKNGWQFTLRECGARRENPSQEEQKPTSPINGSGTKRPCRPEGEYGLWEHRHRYACWAASRAAGTSPLFRFPVASGIAALSEAGILEHLRSNSVPDSPIRFDEWHSRICESLRLATCSGSVEPAYGVRAKLLNVYLKTMVVLDRGFSEEVRSVIHPPIDRLLLGALSSLNQLSIPEKSFFRQAAQIGWSNFDRETYLRVIQAIRAITPPTDGLWTVEEHWQGHH